MARILIKNGRVWDGEKFFSADVLTENDKISKIEPCITDAAEFVWDARGKTVSPGLVDAHVHISGGTFGIHPAMGTLPFGVTAVADAGVGNPKRLEYCGVRHTLFVGVAVKDNHADFTDTLRLLPECGNKAIGLKLYFDRTISAVKDRTALEETVAFAEEHGLTVMVHSSNPPVSMAELLAVLRKGDILTHTYHGGVNHVADDNFECIKSARARGVIIDAGLAGHIHTDFQVFRDGIACGAIPDIISTDITRFSAYKRGGKYGLPMCMSIARHLGMNETDIFKAVTSTAAEALGKQDEWGKLAPGRNADICVLEYADEGFDLTDRSGNHIKSEVGYRNLLTVADGEIVYRR